MHKGSSIHENASYFFLTAAYDCDGVGSLFVGGTNFMRIYKSIRHYKIGAYTVYTNSNSVIDSTK